MKTKNLLNFILSSFVLTSQLQAAGENPYAEGTGRPVLNQQVVKAVLEYGDTSKAALGRALSNAQGKSLSEANGIYLEAIMKVVVKSYANKYYTELLFRQILNQALLLTYGTPTADGKGIQKQGLLKNISNQDLLTVILEDSIKLAIDVYNDDRSAILSGKFSDGAINSVALKQLELTREWMASVMEFEGAMHALGVMGVQSFLQTINHDDNMQVNLIAEEIQDATELLDTHERVNFKDPKMPGYMRVLRGKLHKLNDAMAKKVKVIGKDNGESSSISHAQDEPGDTALKIDKELLNKCIDHHDSSMGLAAATDKCIYLFKSGDLEYYKHAQFDYCVDLHDGTMGYSGAANFCVREGKNKNLELYAHKKLVPCIDTYDGSMGASGATKICIEKVKNGDIEFF